MSSWYKVRENCSIAQDVYPGKISPKACLPYLECTVEMVLMPKAAVIITADKAVRKQAYKCFTKPADVMNNVAHAYYYFFAKVEEQGMLSADFNQSWPHIIAHVINIEENQKL